MSDKNIVIAADHNGVELKSILVSKLIELGYSPIDLGPYDTDVSVDYVDYAKQLAMIVGSGSCVRGILICGTGVGMSITANRLPGVRAALVHNLETAPKCREHNNANVLCLGSWINSIEINIEILETWLNSKFGEGRHNKRLAKLDKTNSSKVVFTNGVFDILHTGHIDLLEFSKNLGDKLVVALNDDASVKLLKGEARPINNENDRKKLLASIKGVDEVILFDGNLPEVREKVKPQVIVKGGEWTAEEVRKRDSVPDEVEIVIYNLVEDYSTTNVLKKIHNLDTWEKKSD
jgi:ribose 5-phosphate isomerase B